MKLLSISNFLLAITLTTETWSFEVQLPFQSAVSSSLPLLELHKALVEQESISGNEYNVARYLTRYLNSINLTVETQEVGSYEGSKQPRENILAYIGDQRKTKTLVTSHIDTVPPFWEYKRDGDLIWGRGTVDAKGSVATQIKAFEELREANKIQEGDVALLFVVGEEVHGDGMKRANDLDISWQTCIFGEPTELKLASGHKGITSFDIRAKGKAGHSGYPSTGRSANAMLIPALFALLSAELPYSKKYGNTTLNIGRMEGGVAGNVIAEDASAKITIRIADGTPEDIQKIVLDTVKKTGEKLDVTFHGGYGPVYIDSDVPGFETIVVNYGTDIPNLRGDHKRYLYGPGSILEAHSAHEHLKVSELEEAVKGYKSLIEHSLK